MKLALALVFTAACGKSEPAATTLAPSGSANLTHEVMSSDVIPAETQQLVTAIIPSWTATTAELRLWERDAGSSWKLVMGPWPGVIGKTGAGWGMGRHGRGPAPGRPGPLKVEGDGKSPAGAFLLAGAYGSADSVKTGVPYQHVDDGWQCVDDPKSARYNTIVDKRTVTKDWSSAEEMKRPDALYTWVVDVAHNPTRIPNGGSCIFLHVWDGADSTTVGCTAMEEPTLAKLIGELSAARQPMFVLLPSDEYAALAPSWGLPAPR